MEVLVTGGAGFVGSTVASALLDGGHRPIIVDDLTTGREEFTRGRVFYAGDIADRDLVLRIFDEHPSIFAVVHCAGLAVAPDSSSQPIEYYRTNVTKTLDLVETLISCGCHRLLLSSSASIYQSDRGSIVEESSPMSPASPYARTKLVVEHMLQDVSSATSLRVVALRYFNPIGADPLMRTGPHVRAPTHVLTRLILARAERRPFHVTGCDFPTRDGSGIRDYVHVWDLALAHVAALERFDTVLAHDAWRAYNLGSGTGTTVLELVQEFERMTGSAIDVVRSARRAGDVAGSFASNSRAKSELGWVPLRSIADGIADAGTWFLRQKESFGTWQE